MKFSLGTVFFNPTKFDIESFIKLSSNFKNSFCYLNSDLSKYQFDLLEGVSNICILGSKHNDGLSVAYNKILSKALEIYSEFVLLTDQDSRFDKLILNDFIKNVSLKEKENPKVAIFSMMPQSINNKVEINLRNRKNKFVSLKFSINSGSFLRLKAWNEIGGYDEKLFIDKIDTDFCNNLIKNNWEILKSEDHKFSHSIGHTKIFLFGLIKFNSQNEFRHYHSMESRIYILKKFKKNNPGKNLIFYIKIFKFILQVIKHNFLIIFFEDRKLIKLINIFKPFFK